MRAHRLANLVFIGLGLVIPVKAWAFDWEDLWQRPEQRLQHLMDQKAYEKAEQYTETAEQQGVLKYRSGNYSEAVELFESTASQFNLGTAQVQAGQYAAAIDSFDQVLANSPEYNDAMHNRKIAQQLLDRQMEQQESEGEGQEQSNQQDSGGDGSQSEEQPPSNSEGEESPENEKSSAGSEQPQENPEGSQPDKQSEEESQDKQLAQATPSEPHDEKQQAMDQMLQQVPDDPAGLLKARIFREHQRNYNGSKDREEAW